MAEGLNVNTCHVDWHHPQFWPYTSLHIPLKSSGKHERSPGFLIFWGGIERSQWHEKSWYQSKYYSAFNYYKEFCPTTNDSGRTGGSICSFIHSTRTLTYIHRLLVAFCSLYWSAYLLEYTNQSSVSEIPRWPHWGGKRLIFTKYIFQIYRYVYQIHIIDEEYLWHFGLI